MAEPPGISASPPETVFLRCKAAACAARLANTAALSDFEFSFTISTSLTVDPWINYEIKLLSDILEEEKTA